MVLKFTYKPGSVWVRTHTHIIYHYYASVVKQNIHSPHNIALGCSVSVNMNVSVVKHRESDVALLMYDIYEGTYEITSFTRF